ncbi:MAG: biotin transporter BioY [Egibacteraceae bacterium]
MSASAPLIGPRPVLADLVPRTAVRTVALVLGAALLTAAASRWLKIPLPFSPVPITGGTFAVLLTGAALGPARGAAGQLTYVALGAVGLPFFSTGSGLEFLAGASGGYVLGFIPAAALVGACARRGWDRRPLGMVGTFALGSAVIYACGVPWLAVVGGFGPGEAVLRGLAPFLLGDALKAVAAAAALPSAWRLVGPRS